MALQAVVYPQDPFASYHPKDLFNLLDLGPTNSINDSSFETDPIISLLDNDFLENQAESCNLYGQDWNSPPPPALCVPMVPHFSDLALHSSPSEASNTVSGDPPPTSTVRVRPKRRRSKSQKNKEEIENQRMTHIAVERNRRRQMNEYLSALRSLMPESYVQRGDQASIVGGAINFVKELEQRLHSLGAPAQIQEGSHRRSLAPFSEFFTFPQYTTSSSHGNGSVMSQLGIADIEVAVVDSHANLKIRCKRRPKQLLKVVSGLHTMRLSVLHLNVTTHDQIALYTLSLKVEDDCMVNSVDEIATKVYEILGRIEEEAMHMN